MVAEAVAEPVREPCDPECVCSCHERGPAPCNAPTEGGPCALRLGHPVGPEMPGGGHLP